MATVEQQVPPMTEGLRLTRDEFLRRWEMHLEIKFAELIGGIVYMPSPLYADHADSDADVGGPFWLYSANTPGTASGQNCTTFVLEDVPQPDDNLRILPEYGGGSWIEDRCLAGTPELFAEICRSARSSDLRQKFDLYQTAKIPEYLVILLAEQEIRWHRLVNADYQLMQPDADGVWRSQVFPGLWLDGAAMLAGDRARVLAKLQEGLASPEHQTFVAKLASARQKHNS